jgi:hypothetical protein
MILSPSSTSAKSRIASAAARSSLFSSFDTSCIGRTL